MSLLFYVQSPQKLISCRVFHIVLLYFSPHWTIQAGGVFVELCQMLKTVPETCALFSFILFCRSKQLANELNVSPSNLDTLKLTDIRPKRTWLDVHEDFYREPPANPGKILLLYSPDSKQFKELQVAFRSFLELACHCVVLDLFDEELLQAIAYDPEAWIDQLLQDDRFKVIVVCSQVITVINDTK